MAARERDRERQRQRQRQRHRQRDTDRETQTQTQTQTQTHKHTHTHTNTQSHTHTRSVVGFYAARYGWHNTGGDELLERNFEIAVKVWASECCAGLRIVLQCGVHTCDRL